MPMIVVRYVTPSPRPELRPKIAELAAHLGAKILGKDPNVTAVLVEAADPDGWFIAGKKPSEAGLSAFWMDFKITEHSNTRAETTAFVEAAYKGMGELLGPLHEECYVFVHETNADAYGFGGRTQNGRWAAANPG